MPGKPITVSRNAYEALSRAKRGYEEAEGEPTGWERFLLVLLGSFIADELKKNKQLRLK